MIRAFLLTLLLTLAAHAQSTPGRTLTVDPTQPRDLVTQVNAFLASCPAPTPCVIRIPPGAYTVTSGAIRIASPNVSLLGDGASSVHITYNGANFLTFNLDPHFTIEPAGRVAGFSLRCTATASICLQAGSVIGATFEDLTLTGPGNLDSKAPCNGTTAFQFENSPGTWMERWLLRHIQIGGFCTNLHFKASGESSFGYGQVDGLFTNQGPGSRGVDVDKGAQVYHVLGWTQNLNAASTTFADEAFHIAGDLDGTNFGFNGETAGATITLAHLLPGSKMIFSGAYRLYTVGAIPIRRDPGAGTFFIGPFSGDAGVLASTFPTGSIANFARTGQPVDVYPVQQTGGLEAQNPGLTAGFGYVVSRENAAAPFFVFDPRVPFCLATRQGSYQGSVLSQASPVFCVDGSGSIVQANAATLTGLVSASSYRETLTTPASSSAPCTPGQFTDDASFHYVCVAPNIWKRVALANF